MFTCDEFVFVYFFLVRFSDSPKQKLFRASFKFSVSALSTMVESFSPFQQVMVYVFIFSEVSLLFSFPFQRHGTLSSDSNTDTEDAITP